MTTAQPDFEAALAWVVEREGFGEYVNHPADRGGPTRWGVTERVARAHGYTGDMRSYPYEMAEEVFRVDYWNPLALKYLPHHGVARYIFDMSVNHGPQGAKGGATRIVQRAVNTVRQFDSPGYQVKVDGWWGPATLTAVKSLAHNYPESLLAAMKHSRFTVFDRLARRRPSQRSFWKGWIKRCA